MPTPLSQQRLRRTGLGAASSVDLGTEGCACGKRLLRQLSYGRVCVPIYARFLGLGVLRATNDLGLAAGASKIERAYGSECHLPLAPKGKQT